MLTPRFLKLFPALLSLMFAAAMFVQMKAWKVEDDPTAFHESVRASVSAIPVRFNLWEGTEIKVPSPAAKLLRPNVLFARRYDNERTTRTANVVFVHCTDLRDMSGHYPPNCYPASGWTPDGPNRTADLVLGRRSIRAAVYEFSRSELGGARRSVVYNFFVLPRGFVTTMSEVQAVAGDRRTRSYGAAQVQIILDALTPEEIQVQIVQELLEPLAPIFDMLQIRNEGNRS
jgi:hypothetical protein